MEMNKKMFDIHTKMETLLKEAVVLNDNGEKIDITKEIAKELKKYKKENQYDWDMGNRTESWFIKKFYPSAFLEEEIVLNCVLVPRDIIDKEDDTFCADVSEDLEYNVEKYIDMFNKRITPLLVCFNREIRPNILISNPKDRPYFTEEQCELVSGQPNKPGDQDTYEQLMTMEDKEFKFWTTYDEVPPFFEECGMGKWEDAVADYKERMKRDEEEGIAEERRRYQELLDALTEAEKVKFVEDGELPSEILKIVELDPNSSNLVSKTHKEVIIGTIGDFIGVIYSTDKTDDE